MRYGFREVRPVLFRRTVLLSTLLLLAWFPGASQVEWRSVSGTVLDRRGNTLREAVVQLEDSATLSIRSYKQDGRYHFCRIAWRPRLLA